MTQQRSAGGPPGHTVLLPVKPTATGKSRLGSLDDGLRRRLAEAVALDTLEAALGAARVARVVVVTADEAVARAARDLGAYAVPDRPGDLNASLAAAALRVRRLRPDGSLRIVALCGDLPLLRSASLDAALAGDEPRGLVVDHEGTGTTLLRADDPADFRPLFGPGSAAAHRRAGFVDLPASEDLRRDLDTPADLEAVLAAASATDGDRTAHRTRAVMARVR